MVIINLMVAMALAKAYEVATQRWWRTDNLMFLEFQMSRKVFRHSLARDLFNIHLNIAGVASLLDKLVKS